MIKLGLAIFVIVLMGCTAELEPEQTPESSPPIENISPTSSETHSYFIIPSQVLLEAEYDNQRNNLENLGIPERQLRKQAFEAALGLIGDLLDHKYGDIIQAEILPSAQVAIISADRELDLSILEGLIEATGCLDGSPEPQ